VWRRPGEALHQECVVPTVKHGGGKVMLWGAIARGRPAAMCFIEGKLNADGYIDILNRDMLPSARKIIGPTFTFLEDNDPKHGGPRGSLKVRAWIKRHKVRRIPFPAQSPDLNPIEHVWTRLKTKVNERNPRNVKELSEYIEEEFFSLDRNFIFNLIHSMSA